MVEEKVKEILSEQLGIDESEISLDSNIGEDLGADSLDVVDLIMTIEDEYGIEISDEDVEKVKTVGDFVKYIEDTQ